VNAPAVEGQLVIPVDNEHGAIRLTVIFVFIAVWVISVIVVSALISADGLGLLPILLGFPIAYGVTALLERFLKQHWPSGRVVQLDSDGVRLIRRGQLQEQILSEDPATATLWTFKISKRARVPKGWSMLACAIQFENASLTIYTFMSPRQVEAFSMASHFKKLIAQRKGKSKDDMREDLRLAGEQRRLRDAENYRWMFGAEMTPPDFITYLNRLNTEFSEWMPLD
jgi:hypothetical protein